MTRIPSNRDIRCRGGTSTSSDRGGRSVSSHHQAAAAAVITASSPAHRAVARTPGGRRRGVDVNDVDARKHPDPGPAPDPTGNPGLGQPGGHRLVAADDPVLQAQDRIQPCVPGENGAVHGASGSSARRRIERIRENVDGSAHVDRWARSHDPLPVRSGTHSKAEAIKSRTLTLAGRSTGRWTWPRPSIPWWVPRSPAPPGAQPQSGARARWHGRPGRARLTVQSSPGRSRSWPDPSAVPTSSSRTSIDSRTGPEGRSSLPDHR